MQSTLVLCVGYTHANVITWNVQPPYPFRESPLSTVPASTWRYRKSTTYSTHTRPAMRHRAHFQLLRVRVLPLPLVRPNHSTLLILSPMHQSKVHKPPFPKLPLQNPRIRHKAEPLEQ